MKFPVKLLVGDCEHEGLADIYVGSGPGGPSDLILHLRRGNDDLRIVLTSIAAKVQYEAGKAVVGHVHTPQPPGWSTPTQPGWRRGTATEPGWCWLLEVNGVTFDTDGVVYMIDRWPNDPRNPWRASWRPQSAVNPSKWLFCDDVYGEPAYFATVQDAADAVQKLVS